MRIIEEFENYQCIENEDKITILVDSRTPENIIYTYKLYNGIRSLERFVKVDGIVWWFGAITYTLRIFVNMMTGESFMPFGDDVSKSSSNFIWTEMNKITDNIISVYGYSWGFPYETQILDLSKLKKGTIEYISLTCIYTINDDSSDYCIGDCISYINDEFQFVVVEENDTINIVMYENNGVIAKFVLNKNF